MMCSFHDVHNQRNYTKDCTPVAEQPYAEGVSSSTRFYSLFDPPPGFSLSGDCVQTPHGDLKGCYPNTKQGG